MARLRLHPEHHLVERIGWLRAAVLGANDGIVSTASLIVGVAAAATAPGDVLIAGVAGLVAGAMSMAAGEYVSVSSQADTEHADLARERRRAQATSPRRARRARRASTSQRGLEPRPGAPGRPAADGRPTRWQRTPATSSGFPQSPPRGRLQAALTSAATFSVGARHAAAHGRDRARAPCSCPRSAPPRSSSWRSSARSAPAPAAPMSGARPSRVTFWGALAMALTAGIGKLFGTVV